MRSMGGKGQEEIAFIEYISFLMEGDRYTIPFWCYPVGMPHNTSKFLKYVENLSA